MMNRYSLLLLGMMALSACRHDEERPNDSPNILFIAIDDLRPELGAYGVPEVKSPHLDQLANEGRLFRRHYTQVPTCGPSRYCLLTGMRPRTKEQLKNNLMVELISSQPERERPESFVHHLRRNGYYTVGVGKISHSADGLVYGYLDSVSNQRELPYSWDERLSNQGKWGTGWNAFFAYANGENRQSMNKQVAPYEKAGVPDNGYPDGLTTEIAIRKLGELKNRDQPFFLGLGFFKPHLPFTAPAKYWDLYRREEMPISPNPAIPEGINARSLHGSGEFNQYQLTDEKAGLEQAMSDAYARKLRHAYYACISYIDAQVGRVLAELKRLELDENTIIVVWGDHGWHLGDHLVWGKHTLFERALRSAFIVKVPGMAAPGKATDALVETIDIYPTLLELCGLQVDYDVDGTSFSALLQEPDTAGKEAAYGYFRNGITVRTDRYRLTRYYREDKPVLELYDHEADPNETINLVESHPEIAQRLQEVLDKGNTGLYAKGTER